MGQFGWFLLSSLFTFWIRSWELSDKIVKTKKKSSFEKVDSSKGATKFFVIVSRKSDPSVQFRFEDKDNGRARTQALKQCFTAGHDDCEVSLIGTTK